MHCGTTDSAVAEASAPPVPLPSVTVPHSLKARNCRLCAVPATPLCGRPLGIDATCHESKPGLTLHCASCILAFGGTL